VSDDALQSAEFVRQHDPDRYLADLFAPVAVRPHLLALHAFALEVADIRRKVSQPALGEIRLKWWETAIRGEHGGNPLAGAVAEAIARFNLPLAAFDNLLQARIFDLYDDAMPTLNDLEGYAGDTESVLMQLGAMILAGGRDPGTAELSGFAGVAVAVTRLLRALPRHAVEGQAFLPADLLARHGGVAEGVTAPASAAALRATVADLRALARRRLDEARGAYSAAGDALLPAFLPAALVPIYLDRMERPGFDPLRDAVDVSPLRRQWTLWRAARAGRF
jgi:phytoene synthase